MKRALPLMLLLLAGLFASARGEASLTLLVYMCGGEIQSEACYDLSEMTEAQTGEDVNIVVLAGGASEWDNEALPGDTRSLVTIRDGRIASVDDWGWRSMGGEGSLMEFLKYGLTEFPAKRTAVVLWNHGGGTEAGLCFDETAEGDDGLTLNEINDVLYDLDEAMGGFHIDIFGCDACMMATYEMAVMLSYYDIDYFIASEEMESGTGWHYTPWLKAVEKDPGMGTEAMCRMIVDSYIEDALKEDPDDSLTMSVVALNQIDPLQDAMERFGGLLLGELERGNISDVRRRRSRMYTFGAYVDRSWDMVDMGAMLDGYAHIDPTVAAQARSELASVVVYNRQTDNLDPCAGLSVLIPQDTRDEFESNSEGMDLSFYMPNWIGFIKTYAGELLSGSYTFSNAALEQVQGGELGGVFASGETYEWDSAAGQYVVSKPGESQVSVGEGEYAFAATLSSEDLKYLDYVEGMLMMDVSDGEDSGYVDLGLTRNNLVDWSSGRVYSLYDGTYPVFGGQLVPLYDQISNERGRRSLIPVKLNGEATYLVVEFPAGGGEGRVIGANAGYDDGGLPIRGTTSLKPGDSIVPVYTLYYDNGGEDMEELEYDGDEITWQDGMTVTYEDASGGEPIDMLFCFVLNDVFGEYRLTDTIYFQM